MSVLENRISYEVSDLLVAKLIKAFNDCSDFQEIINVYVEIAGDDSNIIETVYSYIPRVLNYDTQKFNQFVEFLKTTYPDRLQNIEYLNISYLLKSTLTSSDVLIEKIDEYINLYGIDDDELLLAKLSLILRSTERIEIEAVNSILTKIDEIRKGGANGNNLGQ